MERNPESRSLGRSTHSPHFRPWAKADGSNKASKSIFAVVFLQFSTQYHPRDYAQLSQSDPLEFIVLWVHLQKRHGVAPHLLIVSGDPRSRRSFSRWNSKRIAEEPFQPTVSLVVFQVVTEISRVPLRRFNRLMAVRVLGVARTRSNCLNNMKIESLIQQ